jgi:hypothetical protein
VFSSHTNLYSIVSIKDASAVVHLELFSGSLLWNVSFIRAADD